MKTIFDVTQKIFGKKLTYLILVFAGGVYFAYSYPKYVVTPDTLATVIAKLEKADISQELAMTESEIFSLEREQSELQDVIDKGHPKQKYIDRLTKVNNRIEAFEFKKERLIKTLQNK